jgi:hypothetical protein
VDRTASTARHYRDGSATSTSVMDTDAERSVTFRGCHLGWCHGRDAEGIKPRRAAPKLSQAPPGAVLSAILPTIATVPVKPS